MNKLSDRPKPTHVYIGRDSGGCCLTIITDWGDKETGKEVAGAITDGLTIDRVDWQTYVDVVSNEATFMRCGCPVEVKPEQMEMF